MNRQAEFPIRCSHCSIWIHDIVRLVMHHDSRCVNRLLNTDKKL